jgi:transposase
VIVFIDESGFSERPTVARTWARRGQTPIIQYCFNWHQLSAIAGLTFWNFYFRLFPGTINSERVIEFLKALRAQIKRPLLIIWDRSQTHRSRLVKKFLESLDGELQLEFLPGYAPELNPVEAIWAHVKPHEMANFLAENFAQLNEFARNRLKSMQRRPRLIAAFWKQAELAL